MARTDACAAIVLLLASALLPAAGKTSSRPAEREGSVTWSQSYDVGTQVAAMEKSPVLLFFTASWCPWCHRLEREVLVEPKVASELRKFVCVKLDVDKNHDVAMAYGVASMPRIVVINTHREIIGDWLGYHDAGEFLRLLGDIQPYVNETAGTKKAPQVGRPVGSSLPANGASPATAPDDLAGLTELLGNKEPSIRQNAMKIVLKNGSSALSAMLDALDHEYLGVRIAAWKIVRTLTKTDLSFDPWAPLAERAEQVRNLWEQLKVTPSASPPADIQTP
ncbi:MAG: thioredoxin family protein [Sedimentisphaerales bacterium]|nr:thioredoxin family protein [Sedimentisphaerales bacterium]